MTATVELPPAFGLGVELRHVEKELSQQLRGQSADERGLVQRVRMSNLVIFTTNLQTAADLSAAVPEIEAVHPARVLLLIADPASEGNELRAAVSVRCRALGRQQQACSEQVTLYTPTGLADHLPFAVRSLVIGDLPTNLWWATPTPPPMAGPLLVELSEHAQQIMYDSLDWPDPVRGVSTTASWIEQTERTDPCEWRVVSDLNWRRLKYWRRLVAQALEPFGDAAGEVITEVLLEHGPAASVQAWMLASWLARRLGWRPLSGVMSPGVEMAWRFGAGKVEAAVRVRRLPEGPPELRVVNLTHRAGGKENWLNIFIESQQRMAIELGGDGTEPRTMTLPALSPAEVVGRQLSDRERDPVFRESMAVAQTMARMVTR
jgi:glucose-6-phosphate dehydrogenase assembly protein OpcA